jgi:hypothetical protein
MVAGRELLNLTKELLKIKTINETKNWVSNYL